MKILSEQISQNILEYKKKIIDNENINLFKNKILKKFHEKKKVYFEDTDENELVLIQKLFDDIKSIKQTLIESSRDIKSIFNHSLQFLKDEKGNKIEINFELIHLEQLNEKIFQDNFIKCLIFFLNKKHKPIINDFKLFYDIKIDTSLLEKKEKKKFEKIIEYNILRVKEEKKKLLLEKKTELAEIKLNNDKNSFNLNTIKGENYIISNDSILKDVNIINNEKNKKKKKPNNIIIMNDGKEKDVKDLDNEQLYQYIQNDDKKPKSKKKKNKKVKNQKEKEKIEEEENEKENENESEKLTEEDKEINSIKLNILNNSCNKFSIRKIRPVFSKDWMNKIQFFVNNVH